MARATVALIAILGLIAASWPASPATAEPAPGSQPPPSPEAKRPAAAKGTAGTTMLNGIDVSNYQHPNGASINWPSVAGSGRSFAFIKATEGNTSCSGSFYTNDWFRSDWAAAARVGMYRGAYHFGRPQHPVVASALDQARYFFAVTGPMQGSGDLPAVLDLESACGLSPSDLATWTRTWLEEVTRLTGRKPLLYTYKSFWPDHMADNATFGAYPLWFARPGVSTPYPLPTGWAAWTFWQTGQDYVPGIQGVVDLDLFNGDAFGLAGLNDFVRPFPTDPIGRLEQVGAAGRDKAVVSGWTIDADSSEPIEVEVLVDGASYERVPASDWRPDIGAFFWPWGSFHGYSLVVTGLSPGGHAICVTALNVGPGTDSALGCSGVTMPTGHPVGVWERLSFGPGGFTFGGWVIDPDTADPVLVDINVDGVVVLTAAADAPRPDVAAFFSDWGPDHGYEITLPIARPGPHDLCVWAHNVGVGINRDFGCRSVVAPDPSPIGVASVTVPPTAGPSAGPLPGPVLIEGWAIDPDTADPVTIDVTVDAAPVAAFPADIDNPIIAWFFPAWTGRHVFSHALSGLTPGTHDICVTARNVGNGADRDLGCTPTTL